MLHDFKREIKLLLIVAVVSAVLAVAGILLFKSVSNQVTHTPPSVSAPSPQPSNAPAVPRAPQKSEASAGFAGWQIYRNEEFGFEFEYPAEFEVRFEAVAFEDRQEPPGRHFLLAEIRPLLIAESERKEMNTITLSHAEMEAAFLKEAYGEGTVYYPGENLNSRWSPLQQVVKNGVVMYTFREATEGIENSGHLTAIIEREGEGSFYLTLAGVDCAHISFSDCPEVRDEDQELFNQILATFRFVDE